MVNNCVDNKDKSYTIGLKKQQQSHEYFLNTNKLSDFDRAGMSLNGTTKNLMSL